MEGFFNFILYCSGLLCLKTPKYSDKFKEYIEDLEKNCFDTRSFEVIIVVPEDNEKEYERILKVCDYTAIDVKLVKLNILNLMKIIILFFSFKLCKRDINSEIS